jgi:hypothetical protein
METTVAWIIVLTAIGLFSYTLGFDHGFKKGRRLRL